MSQMQEEHVVDVLEDELLIHSAPVSDDSEMDITPMIDITFLLLIFFIVSSKMQEDASVILPKAKHGTAVTVKDSAIMTIARGDSDDAAIYLGDGKGDDTRVQATDPEAQEQEIIAYLEQELSEKTYVIVKAEKNVKHGDVARVSKAVGKVTTEEKIKFIYVAVLEEQ